MADLPIDTPNEDLTVEDRLDQGHGVWYNCGTHHYESKDRTIEGTSGYAVLQFTDQEYYREIGGPLFAADIWFWEHQPRAVRVLQMANTPDLFKRGIIAARLMAQGYPINYGVHVRAESPSSIMWQRKRLGQTTSTPGNAYFEIPEVPWPGVIKNPVTIRSL